MCELCDHELQTPAADFTYVALAVRGEKAKDEFWWFQCPTCGEEVKYGINELPTVDTSFPCGCNDSWVVRYYDDEKS